WWQDSRALRSVRQVWQHQIFLPAEFSLLFVKCSFLFPPQAGLYRIAFQFSQSVCGNPTGCARINLLHSFGCGDRGAVQSQIAFADVAQGSVDGFTDEVPVIARFAQKYRKNAFELRVCRLLVAVGKISDESKTCAFLEFAGMICPFERAIPGCTGENE